MNFNISPHRFFFFNCSESPNPTRRQEMYLSMEEVCSPANYTCVQYAKTWRYHHSFRRETAGCGKFNHGGKIGAISERTAKMRTAETAAGAQRDMKSEQLMLKHIKEHTHTGKNQASSSEIFCGDSNVTDWPTLWPFQAPRLQKAASQEGITPRRPSPEPICNQQRFLF